MSPSPQLAPPGSSVYSSPTMYVGDGTWDAQSNTFLLPNLQGLNFATMRYNGMGNRFAEITQYYYWIRAHGIIAAIVFLFVVPTAILINRFYKRNPQMAVRLHIWLQIITLLLSTVIIILGFMAVGPERNLTNPHHGIGLAIYVLILIQFIGGWWVHSRAKRKRLIYISLKLVLHKWLGRIIVLLGIVQIPLGLTLYGSPVWLFVLYTLVTFTLLCIYFVLQYRREKRREREDSEYSYDSGSGSVIDERRRRGSRFVTLAEGAAAGVGLSALANRFRNRRRDPDGPEVIGSRRHSGSYVEEEKYSQYGRDPGREGGFREKLLGIGVVAAAAYYITRMLGKKNEEHDDSEGTVTTEDSVTRMERVEEGRPLPSGQNPLSQNPAQHLAHRRSTSSMSYDTQMSEEGPERQGHGLRNALLGLGGGLGAIGLGNVFKKRRERKEQRRIDALREQEIEEERLARANSQRYTGDGAPPRRSGRQASVTESANFSSDQIRPAGGIPPPPPPGGTLPLAAAVAGGLAGAAMADRNRQGTTLGTNNPVVSGTHLPGSGPVPPLVPPGTPGGERHESSGSEMYTSASGRRHHRHRSYDTAAAAAVAGGAAGLVAGEALAARRDRDRSRHSAGDGSVGSPPVSVKVKMHSDGRHVTLRRLPEQEAAAERAARRSSRDRNGRLRGDSVSSLSGPTGGERWRRTEALERQQAMDMDRERANLQAARAQINEGKLAVPLPGPPPLPPPPPQHGVANYPPPPPIPSSSSPLGPPGSVGSPYDGTGTEASAEYANNRKRRRAERAQAKQAKEARGAGQAMEFT